MLMQGLQGLEVEMQGLGLEAVYDLGECRV